MGSVFVQYEVEGYNISDVFDFLKNKYIKMYGNHGYTGTIASCYLGGCTKKYTGDFSKKNLTESKKIIQKLIDDEYIDKGCLSYIDLGVVSYDLCGVKLEKNNVKPKYELRYAIVEDNKILYSDKSKQLVESKLLNIAIDHPEAMLSQEYVLVSGSSIIATPKITIKSTKKKPTQIPKSKTLKEKHRYLIFGYAPE